MGLTTFAELSPPYATIVADPPWPAGVKGSGYVRGVGRRYGAGGRRRRATSLGYTTLPLDDIYALPVSDLAAENAALWLWVTAGHNRVGVGVTCAEAWGFSVVGEFVWAKPNFGMGAFPRPQHEILLLCRRGTVTFDRTDVGSVQQWRQNYGKNGGKAHSAKPPAAYDLIEEVSPAPYLELFCRTPRLGWDSWGYGYELERDGHSDAAGDPQSGHDGQQTGGGGPASPSRSPLPRHLTEPRMAP